MKRLLELSPISGGSYLVGAGIALRTLQYCLSQWEKHRKEIHDAIDREIRTKEFNLELERHEKINSIKKIS